MSAKISNLGTLNGGSTSVIFLLGLYDLFQIAGSVLIPCSMQTAILRTCINVTGNTLCEVCSMDQLSGTLQT